MLQHAVNRGYGGNLRSMFAAATKDLIFYTDGDAQYDPAELADLYPRLRPDVDVVQGWKIERRDPIAPQDHRPRVPPLRQAGGSACT